MRNKKLKLFFLVLGLAAIAALVILKMKGNGASDEVVNEINPAIGEIRIIISSTGTVLPKNRLEVKPPVPGRVENVLVKEGENVLHGQILAWMSSTERAALLDAAQGQGEKELNYWKEAYKPIALLSPIDGEVIVATTQPGQTVTTSDAIVVLSDHLIVRAEVDETDIDDISKNMKAIITLDAYPDTKINASVEHMYYESETVNNVTIYHVDLVLQEVPHFYRSGMNASVDFVLKDKKDILVIPVDAVYKNGENYCLVKQPNGKDPVKTRVELGITDDKNIEVISGVSQKDCLIIKSKKYSLPKSSSGSNTFMPFGKKKESAKK